MRALAADLPDIKKVYLGAGILEKWHPKQWSDYVGDEEAGRLVREYLADFPARQAQGEGILFWGPNGVGKTLLMNLLLKDLLHQRVRVQVVSFSTVVREFTRNWRGEGNWNRLLKAQVLGIEELDKSFKASAVSLDLVQSALDALLRYRVQRLRPTIATTNLDPGHFEQAFGKSIASLFQEIGKVVHVDGADYRTQIFNEQHPQSAAERPTAGVGKVGLF